MNNYRRKNERKQDQKGKVKERPEKVEGNGCKEANGQGESEQKQK